MGELWIKICKDDFDFFDNGSIVMFRAIYSNLVSNKRYDGIITNVAHVTKRPSSPILKHLAEELNESYHAIKNITEHLEDLE